MFPSRPPVKSTSRPMPPNRSRPSPRRASSPSKAPASTSCPRIPRTSTSCPSRTVLHRRLGWASPAHRRTRVAPPTWAIIPQHRASLPRDPTFHHPVRLHRTCRMTRTTATKATSRRGLVGEGRVDARAGAETPRWAQTSGRARERTTMYANRCTREPVMG